MPVFCLFWMFCLHQVFHSAFASLLFSTCSCSDGWSMVSKSLQDNYVSGQSVGQVRSGQDSLKAYRRIVKTGSHGVDIYVWPLFHLLNVLLIWFFCFFCDGRTLLESLYTQKARVNIHLVQTFKQVHLFQSFLPMGRRRRKPMVDQQKEQEKKKKISLSKEDIA